MFKLPQLGVGLGFRPPFLADLFCHRQEVDFLEITADHYFNPLPSKQDELKLLASHFRLIPHGLDLSLGSADGLDLAYLEQFARLIEQLNPPWWSEHIAFTRACGVEIGHLAPVPFNRESLGVLTKNIQQAQLRIPAPLILENITYSAPQPGSDMSEGEFLRHLTEETGCGLLLDVTNLHVNSVNQRADPRVLLDALPLERVVQLHFVGVDIHDQQLIDSHASPTPEPIWTLLEEVLSRASVKGAILERDDRLPPLTELLPELRRARAIGRAHSRWP